MTKTVAPEIGITLLEHARKAGVDWLYQCSKGTCARCRCFVSAGAERLAEPNDKEWDRLDPEELEGGYRLGCQAVVVERGEIVAANKTYF